MASRGINKVILVGNLGQDPEIRYTGSNVAVCTVSLATSRTYRNRETNEDIEKTEWHRLVFFRRLAEIASEYLTKGSQIYIEGRLQTREWEDQKTGGRRWTTEVVVDEMVMLGGRGGSGGGGGGKSSEPPSRSDDRSSTSRDSGGGEEFDDDIPF